MSDSLPIVIVSGLPRSGTSLLMQMLFVGGAPLLFDSVRRPDQHNPRGYFELERVKRLRDENSWLAEARGSVLKVVSPLLQDLPTGNAYRVILMERSVIEVALSQSKMLREMKPHGVPILAARLVTTLRGFEAEVDQLLNTRDDFETLRIAYRELLADPIHFSRRIADFLRPVWPELELNLDAMAAAVDWGAFHQRE